VTTRKVTGAQHVSRDCYVCGVENGVGLHARFFELEGGELLGVFAPKGDHQGYPGRLHGGIAATILDETIGRAVGIGDPQAFGVTVELTVRYRKPVPLDRDVRAVGRITRNAGRLFEGTGEILLEDGTVAVEGSARYLRMSVDRIADGELADGRWFPDDRDVPESVDL
jgi:acyl-coenzyme A thioesterase PaaI-like protein